MSKRNESQGKSTQPQRPQSEQIDRELAARALKKRAEGELPSRDEIAALRRFERAQEALDDCEHEIRRYFGNGQGEIGDKTS